MPAILLPNRTKTKTGEVLTDAYATIASYYASSRAGRAEIVVEIYANEQAYLDRKTPAETIRYTLSGASYTALDQLLRSRAITYLLTQPEFQGGTQVADAVRS